MRQFKEIPLLESLFPEICILLFHR